MMQGRRTCSNGDVGLCERQLASVQAACGGVIHKAAFPDHHLVELNASASVATAATFTTFLQVSNVALVGGSSQPACPDHKRCCHTPCNASTACMLSVQPCQLFYRCSPVCSLHHRRSAMLFLLAAARATSSCCNSTIHTAVQEALT